MAFCTSKADVQFRFRCNKNDIVFWVWGAFVDIEHFLVWPVFDFLILLTFTTATIIIAVMCNYLFSRILFLMIWRLKSVLFKRLPPFAALARRLVEGLQLILPTRRSLGQPESEACKYFTFCYQEASAVVQLWTLPLWALLGWTMNQRTLSYFIRGNITVRLISCLTD